MKLKNAIKILETQKSKLLDKNMPKDETWVSQTGSYIKDFFGESSEEYKFISKFSFSILVSSIMTTDQKIHLFDSNEKKAIKFMEDCIETIENKGLYKVKGKWSIWFGNPDNKWKIFIFVVGTLLTIAGIITAILKS